MIQQAVLIAFLIQWLLFIPAYYFQTEKFYDLTGSATYLFIVIYISFQSYSAINVNMGSEMKNLRANIYGAGDSDGCA